MKRRVQTEAYFKEFTVHWLNLLYIILCTAYQLMPCFIFTFRLCACSAAAPWWKLILNVAAHLFLLLSSLLCSIPTYVWDCFIGTWKTCWMLLYFCYLIYDKLRFFFSLYGNKVMKPVKIRLWSQRQRQHPLNDLILCALCVQNFRVPPPTACVFVLYASSCTPNDRHFYQSQQGGQCWLAMFVV